ncbi:ABC transporter permease [Actinophytocola sp.]|uniref:ABC transporter permease n=1 Tax=Actinophytocola sp. TaxID=1872138 RepID=UPI002ED2A75B
MTTLSYAMRDSTTMLRRNMRHMQRYPSLTVMLVGQPIVLLLLFVYVFGGTLGNGLGGAAVSGVGGRAAYVGYVTPAILLITVTSAVLGTAISVAMDMTEGIIARFRTMAISKASVLTGHVIGTVIQTAIGLAVVIGVALLVGFSPTAGVGEWFAVAGVLLLLTIALTWLAVAMGLAAKSVETASNTPMIFTLLPFMGSGFVPTDSLPAWLRWFAEYQPFTPVIETIRGLLLGTPIGNSALLTVGWCVLLTVLGYAWSKSLFAKERTR